MIPYEEQLRFVKIILRLFDNEKADIDSLEKILAMTELVKKHSTSDNAVIYDAAEYIYEQMRILKQENGAYDDKQMRENLDTLIGNLS